MNTQYLNEIKHFKLLSQEEENHLFEQYHNGDDKAFQTLVNHNLYNVVIIIDKIGYRNHKDKDELISEGNIALMTAIKGYDQDKYPSRFVSYLRTCVTNAAYKYFINYDASIRIPSHKIKLYKKIDKYDDMDKAILVLELTPKQVKEYYHHNFIQPEYIEEQTYTNNNEDSVIQEPGILDTNGDNYNFIQFITQYLLPREQKVIRLSFGLDGGKPHTNRAIGKLLDLTDSHICAIKYTALDKLRIFLDNNQKVI